MMTSMPGADDLSGFQVVILAGGKGTRLQGVAGALPKSLVPVGGRPFVEHQLELLAGNGLRQVLMCVGHMGDQIERHVGNGERFGVVVNYSREDPGRLLGTGGALVNALPVLEDAFMVMYGDSYLSTEYLPVVQQFKKAKCLALMCVYRNEGRWDASNVRIQGDRVVYYSKRAAAGDADHIDYGLSVYRKEVFLRYRVEAGPVDLGSIQGDLVAQGDMAAYVVGQRFFEIGKPEGLAELDRWLLSRKGAM